MMLNRNGLNYNSKSSMPIPIPVPKKLKNEETLETMMNIIILYLNMVQLIIQHHQF